MNTSLKAKIDQGIEAYQASDYTEIKNQDELDTFFEEMRRERKRYGAER